MSAIRKLIDEHQTGDPDETCKAVMDATGIAKKHRDLFWPLLRDECRRLARTAVRDAERGDINDSHPDPGHTPGDTHSALAGVGVRADFLNKRIYTGNGNYVLWGEATVEDHQSRVAYLASLRNGIDDTIQLHVEAMELIEAAGVTCLNDLHEGEVAA